MGELTVNHPGELVEEGNRNNPLLIVALASLMVLIAGTLLYPDSFSDVALHLGPVRISAVAILFVISAPAVLLFLFRQRQQLRLRSFDVAILAVIGYMTVRGLLADNPVNLRGLTLAYACYVLVLYFGIAVVGQQEISVRTFFMVFAGLGIIIAAYGVLEFFVGNNFLYAEITRASLPKPLHGFFRSGSTLAHPVVFGMFLIQAAPFMVFFFARSRTRMKKLAWGAAIVVAALALEMTVTKGSWITASILGLAAIVWAWRYKSARRPILLLTLAIIVTLSVFTLVFSDNMSSGVFSNARKEESFSSRWNMWKTVPQAFAAQPVFGYGMWKGNATVSYLEAPEREKLGLKPDTIDNIYLTTPVEEGIVGLLLAGVAVVLFGKKVFDLTPKRRFMIWMIPLAVSLSAIFIDGFTFDSFLVWPNMVCFWSAAGLMRAFIERNYFEPII